MTASRQAAFLASCSLLMLFMMGSNRHGGRCDMLAG